MKPGNTRCIFLTPSARAMRERSVSGLVTMTRSSSYLSTRMAFFQTLSPGTMRPRTGRCCSASKKRLVSGRFLQLKHYHAKEYFGDSLERDVLDSNRMGIYAVWFNPMSEEARSSESHVTVHSMENLCYRFSNRSIKNKTRDIVNSFRKDNRPLSFPYSE